MAINNNQDFIATRDKATDSYRESSNLLVQLCNSTTDQLAIILVTAALAFLAIIATSLGDLELLQSLSIHQKAVVMTCACLFVISVILGIIALTLEIKYLHKTYIKHNNVVDDLLRSKGWSDMQRIQDTTIKELQKENKNAGFRLIVSQGISFTLGVIAALVYVGLLLFGH